MIFLLYGRTSGVSHILISSTMNLLISESIQTNVSHDVYYDLYVDYKTGNATYKTSLTYTFVKQNGTWMLADFLIN